MKPSYTTRTSRFAIRAELPPLTWPAPLDELPPLAVTKAPESPGWLDTQPMSAHIGLDATEPVRGAAFKESLDGLQVRELIGSRLFEQLFGPRPDPGLDDKT
jgi:hypothetical protein